MEDLKELIKISYMYYKKNMTQGEIAEKLKTSRQRVNRLLKKAIDENIVSIQIASLENYNFELEEKLEDKFSLDQVLVVNSIDESTIINDIASVAAEYLSKNLEKNSFLGLTQGRTLSKISEHIEENKGLGVNVVQLLGGSNIIYTDQQPDQITRALGNKLGGESFVFFAPAIFEDKELKDAFCKDINMVSTMETIDKCTTIIAGIGEIKEDTLLFNSKAFNDEYVSTLLKSGCVGDIGFRWFDKDGNIVDHKYDSRTVGYNVLINKNKAKIIGVAGGNRKFEAILAALRGGFLDVLITDNITAEKLNNL
ncbi:MAG: sugar-binding transcriptional regulator [Bacillota bacterium]|nr:sugar-binding transcriptional regulator [Bacillota bacterium]